MKIHGYADDGLEDEDVVLAELAEVTLVATPDELRRIARFLEECATGMEARGKSWEHEHLSDKDRNFAGAPHLVVFNPEYGQGTASPPGGSIKHGRGGVQYQDIDIGVGKIAGRDSTVEVLYTLSLNRGDVVQRDMKYSFSLTARNVIAGLAYGVEGMRVGGRRRIRVAPHLAYRDAGVPDQIPPNAVLIFEVALLSVSEQQNK
jgi:hypothetical protein